MTCGSGAHTSDASSVLSSGLIVLNSAPSNDHAYTYPASPGVTSVGGADFKILFMLYRTCISHYSLKELEMKLLQEINRKYVNIK